MSNAPTTTGTRWARCGPFVFPAVGFAMAMLFHGADLGKYLDDWMLCRRDIQTLQIQRLTDLGQPGFYRPLSRIVSPMQQTLLWEHDRVIHLLLIAAHALNAMLVGRLLVAIGCGRRTAIAGAMFFALYPAAHEAMFWSSIIATSLATAGFTIIALVQVWIARRAGNRSAWWGVPLMAALAFGVCCLNEQPAMGILALPALSLAVTSRTLGILSVRRWTAAIVPGFVSGLAVLAYLWLLVSTAPPGERAAAGQWTPRGELVAKASRLAESVADVTLMRNFTGGALQMGWRSLRESPWLGLAFAVALLSSGILFAQWWVRDPVVGPGAGPSDDLPGVPRWTWRLWLVAFGLGIFVLAWVPAWVVWIYTADSRLCYPAAVGLVVAFAASVDGFGNARYPARARGRARSVPIVRTIGAGLVITVAVTFAIMQVGLQRSYRERAAWEARQAAELRAMIPNPPERAIFVVMSAPLRTRTLPPTGFRAFDTAVISVWENPWCVHWFLRWQYRRSDLRAIPSEGWPGPAILDIYKGGMRTRRNSWDPSVRRDEAGGYRLAWRRVVPILIEDDGRMRVVTRIIVRDRESGEDVLSVEPPLVKGILTAGGEPAERIGERTFVFVREGATNSRP